MAIIVEIVAVWILLSFVLGPLLAWAFFYPERRARALQEAHDRWIATHPTVAIEMMPEWLRWEDTTEGNVERKNAKQLYQPSSTSR